MKREKAISIQGDPLSIFINKEEIALRVETLAQQIYRDMEGETPLFICVLNGAYVFAADLLRAYPGDGEIAFIRLSSYEGTQSSGAIKTAMGLTDDIKGRQVVVVEDIIDTGLTMQHLVADLSSKGAARVRVAALFVKPSNLKCDVKIDYHCFEIPNKFIVGYGLDFDGLYRNLPDIWAK